MKRTCSVCTGVSLALTSGKEPASHYLRPTDVVLSFVAPFADHHTIRMPKQRKSARTTVRVDIDPGSAVKGPKKT